MALLNATRQFDEVKKAATSAISDLFPVEKKKHKLILNNVWVEDNLDTLDYKKQAEIKNKNGTWGANVYADLTLVDKNTGKTIDSQKKIRLLTLPKMTERFSYLVKGNEYQVTNQLRLKSGAYVKKTKAGSVKTQINMARGGRAELDINDKGIIILKVAKAKIPLYPLLKGMGISDSQIQSYWGKQVLLQNQDTNTSPDYAIKRLASALTRTKTESLETARDQIKTYINERTEINPEMTKFTLGKEFKTFNPELWLSASKKLVRVVRGDEEPDDVDNLAFKELYSEEDSIKERITSNKRMLLNKIQRNLDTRDKIADIVNWNSFGNIIETFYTNDERSNVTEQTNPLHMISGRTRVSFMGPGGITDIQKVTEETRNVHPTHLSFIDPVHTPESEKIGLNLNLAVGSTRKGKALASAFYDVKRGKTVTLTPMDLFDKRVAFPDDWDPKTKKFKKNKIKVNYKGSIQMVSPNKVDYVIPTPQLAFSVSTNLIPYLANDNGNRTMMAGKHMEQAIGLKYREQPLVQNKIPGSDNTFEKAIGEALIKSQKAPVDGEVVKVTPDAITIKSGKEHKTVNLYHNFALNQKSHLNHTPTVKVGDTVTKGQVLAESNFTKDGVLALGKNLRVGYLPYKGYNFEDGIVITDTAAKKLTSEHLTKIESAIGPKHILSLPKFVAHFPNDINTRNRAMLDQDGVIKKGSTVNLGDILVAGLKSTESVSGVSPIKARFHKSLTKKFQKTVETWDYEFQGKVVDVIKTKNSITVFVKSDQPAVIGDKIAGRHGNKGIITKIIPDEHAPKNKDGDPVEILMNPHGVVSRINIGQIYESASAKAALKKGEIKKIENFSDQNVLEVVKDELKKAGVSDEEELFDPFTNKSIGKVHVGNPYILKLDKQSEVNFSVRGEGGPVTKTSEQPVKGGKEGSKAVDMLTMYGLLSHGARANLKEIATYKSENNPELWEAIKYGRNLPAPKTTYAFNKFVNMLKASGVDVAKDGTKFYLGPLTDKHTSSMSKMSIKDPMFITTKGKKRVLKKGGFFDIENLGGVDGDQWGHIEMKEKTLNPIFEEAVSVITGMKKADVEKMSNSNIQALEQKLNQINVKDEIKRLSSDMRTLKGTPLNKAVKKFRILNALDKMNLSPAEAYLRKKIPVIPSKMRPATELPTGDVAADDVNLLYRNVGVINKMMKQPVVDMLPDDEMAEIRNELNNNIKGLSGLETIKIGNRDRSGFITQIKGSTQPKRGFFQNKVLRKNQNLVGRGTIIPEPKLHMDQVELPEDMAWKLYAPFAIKKLISLGMSAAEANDHMARKTLTATNALKNAMDVRPVILNRAPSLHKFSVMGFQPKITTGKAIKIPPLVVNGFNADFDGDQQLGKVLVLIDDSDIMQTYKNLFNEGTNMTARYKEHVFYTKKGQIFLVDLEDFPKETLIKRKEGEKGPIDFYSVPEGIKVLAYNEKNSDISWQDVSGWSVHHSRAVEIVNLKSGRQIITDDDERAVYGIKAGDLGFTRTNPENASKYKMFVPRVIHLDHPESPQVFSIKGHLYNQNSPNGNPLKESIPLTHEIGYAIGAMAGDGWILRGNQICFSSSNDKVWEKFIGCISKFYPGNLPPTFFKTLGTTSYGHSVKYTITSVTLAMCLSKLIGHGANKKHLPQFFLSTTKEFREGLFAGLIDTDGSISISNAKSKPQLMSNYSSNSFRLANEVLLLAKSIGINGRITEGRTPALLPNWIVSFSNQDIKHVWNGKYIAHTEKIKKLNSVPFIKESAVTAKNDIVPISFGLATHICSCIGAKRDDPKDKKSFYTVFAKAKKVGSVSRQTAKKLNAFCNIRSVLEHKDAKKWLSIVENDFVAWDQVSSFERLHIKETGYDLTVPGFETFMNVEGIILSNTMTAHIPITDKAVREAYKMMPSHNLYKPGTGALMIGPSQESQLGFYLMTKTEEGRGKLNRILPEEFKITKVMDKKESKELFMSLSKKLKNEQFANIIDMIKQMGESEAYQKGFSLSLKDIEILPDKRQVLEKLNKTVDSFLDGKISKDKFQSLVTGRGGFNQVVDQKLKDHLKNKDNSFYEMVNSGARGNESQLRQILASPLIVQDPYGKLIPKPINKSYAEGLDLSDYWVSSYGARKGMMDRALSTQEPGVFNKVLIAATMNNVVSEDDCGTKKGVSFPVASPEVLGRFTQGKHGAIEDKTLIDASIVSALKRANIKTVVVRSPLKCEAPEGTCRTCYGVDENGAVVQIGDNLGVKNGQAISEPMQQMVMNTFHTGGVAGSGGHVGKDRVNLLLDMPEEIRRGKSTLATEGGLVSKVAPSGLGGYNVYIGNKKHVTLPETKLKIKKGDKVSKGDQLSDGIISPQELLKYKGVDNLQTYMTNELQDAYHSQKMPIDRKTFETVVRSITNRTRVKNNPLHAPYLPGDSISISEAEKYNKERKFKTSTNDALGYFSSENLGPLKKGDYLSDKEISMLKGLGIKELNVEKEPLEHEPYVKGFKYLPSSGQDWIASLGARYISKSIINGASQSWSSDTKSYHPIPAYAFGAEFGDDNKGRY